MSFPKRWLFDWLNAALLLCLAASMDGADLCFEIVKRADAGFVYSEAVARWAHTVFFLSSFCSEPIFLNLSRTGKKWFFFSSGCNIDGTMSFLVAVVTATTCDRSWRRCATATTTTSSTETSRYDWLTDSLTDSLSAQTDGQQVSWVLTKAKTQSTFQTKVLNKSRGALMEFAVGFF